MEIKTSKDWWKLVNDHWHNLIKIIAHHIDMNHVAYVAPGDERTPYTGRTVEKELEFLRSSKDTKLARYFHATWGLASEGYAWTVPSWNVLCDLCSEEWVLYEEERI